MTKFAILAGVIALALMTATASAIKFGGLPSPLALQAISLTSSSFIPGPSGTTVGNVVVGMSSGTFTGSLALDDGSTGCNGVPANCADSSKFQLTGPGCASASLGACTLQTAGAAANPTYVKGGAAGSSNTVTIAGGVPVGSFVVGQAQWDTSTFLGNVVDNATPPNTYTKSTTVTDTTHGQASACFWLANVNGVPTTITASGATAFPSMLVDVFSSTGSTLDGGTPTIGPVRNITGAGAINATSVTPTQSGDLLWSSYAETTGFGSPQAMSVGGGATQRSSAVNLMLSETQGTTSGTPITATANTAGTGSFIPCAMLLKPGASGLVVGSYKIQIIATQAGAGGSPFAQPLTVTGADGPVSVAFSPSSAVVSDNCTVASCPATLSTASATMSGGPAFTGTWAASGSNVCTVNAVSGAVTVARTLTGADDGVKTCTITATQNGLSASGNLSVTVQLQTIASTVLSSSSVASGAPTNTTVGTLSSIMSPAQPAGAVTYALGTTGCAGTNNSSFNILAPNTLRTTGALANGAYVICIVSSQTGLGSIGSAFTINVGTNPFQVPGPSIAMFNAPYYTCGTNYYVSTTGNDSRTTTQAQSPATPWLTIQHANDAIPSPSPNTCINVAAGTYGGGATMTKGGNAATSSGYLAYRCTTPSFISGSGCIITDNCNAFASNNSPGSLAYVIIDGFILAASSSIGDCVGYALSLPGKAAPFPSPNVHHTWVLNSIVHGYGEGGYQGINDDFTYVIHSTFYDNSRHSNAAQGSGISDIWPVKLAGYTLTNDDKAAPGTYWNTILGSLATRDTGLGADFFRKVFAWNVTYNNTLNPGYAFNTGTDGNGIIMDTFSGNPGTGPGVYPAQTLISFNVMYNNGGFGGRDQESGSGTHTAGAGLTFANNTMYNNSLWIAGSARGEITISGDDGDFVVNNVAYAVRATSGVLGNNNDYILGGNGGAGSVGLNNVGYCTNQSGQCAAAFNSATWNSALNKDPTLTQPVASTSGFWVDVGLTTPGTDTTPPVGANFVPSPGAPMVGYLSSQAYLPAGTRDSGACDRSLSVCPCPAGC